MASTFTTRNKLEKQGFAENADLWGAPKLNEVFDRIDEAMDGWVVVDASLASSGAVVVPVRADLIATYGNTQPGYVFTVATAPDPLSVHRRGLRVTADAVVRVLQLPVVEKVWFIVVDPPAGGGIAFNPSQFAYVANGVDPVLALAPGVWCVMSTAAGSLRASNMGSVRVDTVRSFGIGQFEIRPEFDKQHLIIELGAAIAPLIQGSIFAPGTPEFFYYPGFSVTITNMSSTSLALTSVDPLRGLNQLGPVEGLTTLPTSRSCRAVWTGTKWIVM